MSKGRKEAAFLTVLKKDFKRRGHWFYKIPDSPSAMRFMISKPFDVFVGMFNRFAGCEAKFLPGPEAFGVRHLRDVQIDGLDKVTARGRGLGFVWLEVHWSRGVYRFYWFEWEEFKAKGAYTKKELEKLKNYVERTSKGRYDLRPFEADFKYHAALKGLK